MQSFELLLQLETNSWRLILPSSSVCVLGLCVMVYHLSAKGEEENIPSAPQMLVTERFQMWFIREH